MTSRACHLSPPLAVLGAAWLMGVTALIGTPALRAQEQAAGQGVAPVYQGFWRNADGTFDLLFGYFNRSWDEEIDVPVGPDNHVEPGAPDQGQPTHFFPQRNRFVFKVTVPADFASREVVWSLTSHGESTQAFATLKPAYVVDETVMMVNFGAGGMGGFMPDLAGNTPPHLTIEGRRTITAKAGTAVTLRAVATDDGKPGVRAIAPSLIGQGRIAPETATGLRLSWFVYRGAGHVVFDPAQPKVWEDYRDGGNSPWAVGWKTPPLPPGNTWTVRATFRDPGTYVVRALAHDGGLVDYDDVTVTVGP